MQSCALNKHRKAGSTLSCLQVGLQAVQEVFPIPLYLFIGLINLGKPIMSEDQLCSILDRREVPGDAGPCPLRWALPGKPTNFLSGSQIRGEGLPQWRPLGVQRSTSSEAMPCQERKREVERPIRLPPTISTRVVSSPERVPSLVCNHCSFCMKRSREQRSVDGILLATIWERPPRWRTSLAERRVPGCCTKHARLERIHCLG